MTVLLKLLLPAIDTFVDKVVLAHWYKGVGDEVGYGEHLADVEVRRIKRMKRDHDPKKILGLRRSRSDADDLYWTADADLLVRVTSADFGTLKRTCAQVGDLLDPGDLLALLATEDDEAAGDLSDDEIAATSEFRATANIVERP